MHDLSVTTTPPMTQSGANFLLTFQCPVIWPIPPQVDILVSDDSPAFSPTMYNRNFTWVETRAKSELRMRLVPLNMLKLSSISFTDTSKAVRCSFFDRIFNLYFMLICVMLSTDLNVKKSGPEIAMPP